MPTDRTRARRVGAASATVESRTLTDLLEAAVAARGEATAIEDEHGAVSYAELADRVRVWAATLAEAGVGHGDRVAIVLPNSLAFVATFFATLARGAAVVPIGAGAHLSEIRRIVDDSGASALISAGGGAPMPASVARLTANPDGLRIARARAGERRSSQMPVPGDVAVVAYSFTTSPPHLVARTHENLWLEAQSFWSVTRLEPSDVCLGAIPLSHAYGLGNALLATIRAGGRLVLRSRFLRRQTLDTLVEKRVTVFPTVPFMARMLAATDRRRSWDLGAIRLCFSAGAALTRDVYDPFLARFGVPLRQIYGLTAAGDVTVNLAPLAALDPSSVGTPLPGVDLRIEDAAGRPVAEGGEGEIVVRSAAAAGGVARPLCTGDLGHWSARGEVVITGRSSAFVNAAGNKVDPPEVEAVLRAHPAVRDVVVFGLPAAHGDESLTAIVVRRGECSEQMLRLHCCTLLATYKVPRLFHFRASLPDPARRGALIEELRAGA